MSQRCPGQPDKLICLRVCAACRLTDAGIARFITACPTLEVLSLYWNLNVGVQTTAALGKSCLQLTSLNLSGCKSITDTGMQQVAAACTQLLCLDLTRYAMASFLIAIFALFCSC